jgi:hypothetical protein
MSDFLTSLIQRQEKPAGLVQPRIPSLFETAGPRLAPEMNVREESREIESAPSRHDDAPVRTAESAPAARTPIHQDSPQPSHADAVQPQSPTTILRNRPVVEIAEETVQAPFAMPARRDVVPHETNADTPSSPPFAPPADAASPRIAPVSAQRESMIEPPAQKTVRVESTIEIRPQAITPSPAPFAPETPRLQAPFQAPDAPRAVTPPQPVISPAQPARTAAPRQTPMPTPHQAEPVIHVTIGRIEVRAVEEREARPRKREAASPVMTLDDYLKSRAKR